MKLLLPLKKVLPHTQNTDGRRIHFKQLVFLSAIIGICGGLLASAYILILKEVLHFVWDVGKPAIYRILPSWLRAVNPIWIITAIGGLFVGLALKLLGQCGEISAVVNNINMKKGSIDIRQTPSMTVTSLMSIGFGGSAGPEAPLVQIIGSLGSKIGEKLKLHGDVIRTLTFSGMGAALGALFSAPLGGALFALEIPHRRGLEYYEALIPSLVAAVLSYSIFDALTGAEFTPYHFSYLPTLTYTHFLESIGIGLIGGLAATLFIYIFRGIEKISDRIRSHTVLLAVLGGLSIGIIPTLFPASFPITPLFWSEYQIKDVITNQGYLTNHYGIILAVGLLGLLALAKMLSVGCTLHSGFKGGFIFPMFFIGASLGLAVSMLSHQSIPAPLSMLCMMAAINVAVTKTPVSTSILLTTLSGMAMLPVIAAASLTSFFLTTNVALIRTQQHRKVRKPDLSNALTNTN